MKYKVGDKFLQEIEIRQIIDPLKYGKQYVVSGLQYANDADLDKLRRPDDMTAEDAWEIARKIVYLYFEDPGEEFSSTYTSSYDLLMKLTPQEAKARIETWEAEKEIKVGDVVVGSAGQNGIVTYINTNNATVIWPDGSWGVKNRNDIKKTGRHIDIQGLLEQIGGE